MSALDRSQVDAALAEIPEPSGAGNLIASKSIRRVTFEGTRLAVDVVLAYPARSRFESLRRTIISALAALPGVTHVDVTVAQQIDAHVVQPGVKLLPGVKNIIAVASGKGGVGKSTVAANLALALASEGAVAGVLDADIYGPSQPVMLGVTGRPEVLDDKMMEPLRGHGLQVNSIGFLIDADNPAIWRGPMATSALDQLLRQTRWHDLDYLVVDMPPGTGDIQLTLAQRAPVTGVVIVTTPQDIALLDAKKGLRMFEKVNIPVLGIVENMSTHVCSQCGHTEAIFGSGGGAAMCEQYGVELLGQVPLDMRIREQTDAGYPTVAAEPDGVTAALYRDIARKVGYKVAQRARDMSSKFPAIVVQHT